MSANRKTYTEEFKRETVGLLEERGQQAFPVGLVQHLENFKGL